MTESTFNTLVGIASVIGAIAACVSAIISYRKAMVSERFAGESESYTDQAKASAEAAEKFAEKASQMLSNRRRMSDFSKLAEEGDTVQREIARFGSACDITSLRGLERQPYAKKVQVFLSKVGSLQSNFSDQDKITKQCNLGDAIIQRFMQAKNATDMRNEGVALCKQITEIRANIATHLREEEKTVPH